DGANETGPAPVPQIPTGHLRSAATPEVRRAAGPKQRESFGAPASGRPLVFRCHKNKAPRERGFFVSPGRRRLLDLGFLELDMLAHDRIILAEAQLLGLRPRVLLGDVV